MTLRELIIKLGADTTDYDRKMVKSTKQLQDFGVQAESVGMRLSAAITLPIAAVGGAALVAAGKMEQTQVAFTTLLKSADAAKSHIEEMKKFTLVTPFQFEDVTKMSRLMQAMGTDVRDVIPHMRIMGDAVSALGGGSDVLERVVRSMSEIGTRGKITGEQLRELSRAGIPALDAIATKLGVTVAEAQEQVTKGMVDAKTATAALLEYMQKRFGGGMQAMSESLLGMMSNLKDKLTFTMAAVGQALIPLAKEVINNYIDPLLGKVQEMAEAFAKLPKPVQGATIGVGAFAAILPPLIWATGTLITNASVIAGAFTKLGGAATLLNVALSPITLVIGSILALMPRMIDFWRGLRKEWENDEFLSTIRGHFVSMDKAMADNLERLRPMAPAFSLVATAAKEVAPPLEKITEHFQELTRVTLESGINTELYNRQVSRQSELIKDLTDYRLKLFVSLWHSFIADGPEVVGTFESLEKELDKSHDLIEKLNKAMNKDALEQLEAQAVEEEKVVKKQKADRYNLTTEVIAASHRMFDGLERDLARNIVQWKGWRDTVKSLWQNLATDLLQIMLKSALKPLEDAFAKLMGGIFGGAAQAGGGVLGTSVGAAGGAAGTIAGGAGTVAGGVSSAAGVATKLGGAAMSGAAQWIGAIGSAVSAVSGVIGNFQFAGMNKSLDVLVNHTLRIFNVVFQMQSENWQMHYGVIAKLDMNFNRLGDIWNTLREGKGSTGATYNFDFRGANLGGASQASLDSMMAAAFNKALASVGG